MNFSGRLFLCSVFLLLSLTHAFDSTTKRVLTSSTSLHAWSLPTPTSPLTFGTWYQECHPTARKTSYLDDLPLEYNFSYDDWPSSDAQPSSTEESVNAPIQHTSPFKRVAKFARRFRRRSE